MADSICFVSDPVDAFRENGNLRLVVNLLVVAMAGPNQGARANIGNQTVILPVQATPAQIVAAFKAEVLARVATFFPDPVSGYDLTGVLPDGRDPVFLPAWNRV